MNSAQLWIGSDAALVSHTKKYLQQLFCQKPGCGNCTPCMQINQQQHHACLWFYPENNYTLEILKPFFTTISRKLDHQEKFFFIFQHADYLSIACSNSLLKSVEEPPPGYHMLFLAHTLQAVSPTLRSRCTISYITKNSGYDEKYDLVNFFTQTSSVNFEAFLQVLDKIPSDDRTTMNILEQIHEYWLHENKKQLQHSVIQSKIKIINNALEKLPMPGSIKLFWKNLFLKMQ